MKNIFLTVILTAALTMQFFGQSLPLLRVSENKHYLETFNGEPFFWLGGTAWELIHRLTREEVDYYLKDRAEKGFTIIQTVILAELDGINTPNAYGHLPLINTDPTNLNENYFEHVDYILKKAEAYGLYVGLLPAWGDKFNLKWGVGPVIFDPENAFIYGELLAKRYAKQSNIVWILGGDRIPESEEQFEIIRQMARGIRSLDQEHLITYHPVGAKKATDVFNEAWLDIDMFQSGHSRTAREYKYVIESKEIMPERPVINGEPRYENNRDRFWEPEEHEWLDDSDVRVSAYWTFLSGAAGYTYGCHDIWQMYTPDHSPISNARTGWKEALHLPGSRQMKYLKELFTAFPWYQIVPDQSLILNDNPENEEYRMSAISDRKDFILAYTPWGRSITLDLTKLNARKVQAYWFNPRSGESLKIGDYKTTETPDFAPWATGRGSDFVLVILDETIDYPLP